MTRSTARWSTALAAAALLALPASAVAQTPGSQQPVPQEPTTQQPATQNPAATAPPQRDEQGSPQEHIRKAEEALNEIPATSLTGNTKARVAELKRHLNAIERAAAANDHASETGAAHRSGRASEPRGKANWSTEVAAADRILTQLLGTQSMSSAGEAIGTTGTTGTTGTAGTSGTRSTEASPAMMDETTRAKLLEVRSHLSAFAASMSGTSSSPTPPTPSASSPTATTESSEAQASAGQVSSSPTANETSAGQQPPSAPQTATQEPGAASPAAAGQQQVDAEAAKRHLTAARNSLSELTQHPAAAQLTGDARTQVSQLISNFNELITTDTEWRASYEKVDANVTALIGGQTTDESPQTPTAPSAGAVGTTGSVSSGLDPTIRQKLVEFRSHLKQFEQAAGGASSGGTASPSSTASPNSTTNPGSTATPSSTPNPTGSAYPSSPATSTPGTTPEQSAGAPQSSSQQGNTQPGSQQPSEEQGHSEAMRHIAAIEAILSGQPGAASPASPTGTTGSAAAGPATLDRAQIEQIRTHLTELRRLLSEANRK